MVLPVYTGGCGRGELCDQTRLRKQERGHTRELACEVRIATILTLKLSLVTLVTTRGQAIARQSCKYYLSKERNTAMVPTILREDSSDVSPNSIRVHLD